MIVPRYITDKPTLIVLGIIQNQFASTRRRLRLVAELYQLEPTVEVRAELKRLTDYLEVLNRAWRALAPTLPRRLAE